MRRQFLTGAAGDGLEGFGVRRAQDERAEQPIPAIIEDAPVFSRQTLSVRYSPHDWRTLWGAAALGQTRILAALLHQGEDIDRRDVHGLTPLLYATDFQQVASLCLLLEWGAFPNVTDLAGRNAVFFVNGQQSERVLTLLLDGGVNLQHRDREGHSALFRARVQGQKYLSRLLERSGAEVGFLEAVAVGDTQMAATLPVRGNLDAFLPSGETLLTRAVLRGDFALTALLLDRGADPNQMDQRGFVPLDAAAEDSRGRLVRLLLDAGADLNAAVSRDARTLRDWAGMLS